MPHITLQMLEGRSSEQKKELIEKMSQTVSEVAKCPIEAVTMTIQEVPKENWGAGGKQHS